MRSAIALTLLVAGCGRAGTTYGDLIASADLDQWWDTDWKKRRLITLNNGTPEELIDFPILLRFESPETLSAGALRLIDDDGETELAYEIDSWDTEGNLWVRVPRIEAGADRLWVYYDNPGVSSGERAVDTWPEPYLAVWHLEPSLVDATGNGNDGVNQGAMSTPGFIGTSILVDASATHVLIPDDPSLHRFQNAVTMSGWANRQMDQTSWRAIFSRAIGTGGENDIWLGFNANRYRAIFGTGSTNITPTGSVAPSGEWLWVVAVYDGVDGRIYVNGVLEPASVEPLDIILANDTNPIYIGADTNTGGPPTDLLEGRLDEVRLESVARSAAWIASQYASMTGTLASFGPEQDIRP